MTFERKVSYKMKNCKTFYESRSTSHFNDTHMEELDSVQKFIEIQGWLRLTFFMCLHNQLSFFNSIIGQMFEKHDSSSRQ